MEFAYLKAEPLSRPGDKIKKCIDKLLDRIQATMNKQGVSLFLFIAAFQGFIAAYFVFWIPSEAENVWLWGFSKARVVLGGGILLAALVFLSIAILVLLAEKTTSWLLGKLYDFLSDGNHLLIVLLTLMDILALNLLFLLAACKPMGNLSPFAIRGESTGIWIILIIIQIIGLLWWVYKKKVSERSFWDRATLKHTILVLVLMSAAFAQWAILVFRIPVFSSLYGWYWKFIDKTGYYFFDWLVPILFVIFILAARYYLRKPQITFRNLLPLIVFGALLQFAFAYIEGGSLEILRESYAKSPHKVYAEFASTGANFLDTIRNYEAVLGGNSFTGTKPPGLIGLYILLEKISFTVNPSPLAHERFYRLTQLIAWIFPFLSMLVIYPLFSLGKRFLGAKNAIIPVLFYLCLPNVILIQLFMDQTLYPLLFVLVIWLTVRAVDKNGLAYSIIAGLLLYLSTFITFSLLPAILFAFLLTGMHGLFVWSGFSISIAKANLTARSLWRYARLGLGIILGFCVLYLLFQRFLNYTLVERYVHAMVIHRSLKNYDTGLGGVFPSILLNNSDYGVWTGTSILILAVLAAFGSLMRIVKKSLTDFDWLSLSFLVTFVAINFVGQTGGETGRLWIFLSPFIVLLAAEKTPEIFRKKEYGVYLIIVLQLITVILTLKFQDFFGG
jgi:hypothetical protein